MYDVDSLDAGKEGEKMNLTVSRTRRSSRTGWLVGAAVSLLGLILVATPGEAATFGTGSAGLAISMQQAVTPILAGPVAFGPRVVVPARPIPRSPCTPPTWVPGKPPWVPGKPPVIPPKPPWAR